MEPRVLISDIKSLAKGAWRMRRAALTALFAVSLFALSTCSPRPSRIDLIKKSGVLKVAVINTPTVCYQGPFGMAGYECDLLRGLAQRLHVRIEYDFLPNGPAVIKAVQDGKAQIGAAGLNMVQLRARGIPYSPSFLRVVQELVYQRGQPKPKSLADITAPIVVIDGSAAAARLKQLKASNPNLIIQTTDTLSTEDLLAQVAQGEISYTVGNSDLISSTRRYYPKLAVAMPISPPERIVWALPSGPDQSIYNTVSDYLNSISTPTIQRLRERYIKNLNNLSYLGVTRFAQDVKNRLPIYINRFKSAGRRYGVDWRLLAAIGYQESHWNPHAVSPTGVRGLMMLTNDTADLLNIDDRTNPTQSIDGAARYFAQLMKSLSSVKQPDRTWMALAAYNMGLGHLYDAQRLVKERGGNPDDWADIKTVLPLLTRPAYYSKTRYGYARGHEALIYVANIRSYYDILTWMEKSQKGAPDKRRHKR